jgi:hypothetical protein
MSGEDRQPRLPSSCHRRSRPLSCLQSAATGLHTAKPSSAPLACSAWAIVTALYVAAFTIPVGAHQRQRPPARPMGAPLHSAPAGRQSAFAPRGAGCGPLARAAPARPAGRCCMCVGGGAALGRLWGAGPTRAAAAAAGVHKHRKQIDLKVADASTAFRVRAAPQPACGACCQRLRCLLPEADPTRPTATPPPPHRHPTATPPPSAWARLDTPRRGTSTRPWLG